MIVFNGITLTKIIYNGIDLDKIIYNGVVVFQKVSSANYTFSSNAQNVNFSALVSNAYSVYNVTVNAGVSVTGTNGVDSIPASGYCYYTISCGESGGECCYEWVTTDPGAPATNGNVALDFSGLSGKTINIYNNGTIKGGDGGYGGGLGALAIKAGANTINIYGNSPINGVDR